MSFLDHLEELRWRVLYALIGIVIGTVVSWIFIDFLVDHILLIPAKTANIKLQNLKPFGQLFLFIQIAIIGGVILSIPNIFFQVWKFISPALRESEKKYITVIVFFSSVCFLSGIVFAYFVMLPLTLKFAGEFGSATIENNFAITEYFSIIISVMLGAALVFELPMLSFFLSKLGIITPAFMRKYRRHAIIGILIFAAILTPGTDPVAQVLLAIPLVFLYEISIFVSKYSMKKKS
ncbi:MAG: twin-arginine translocase subunit TatC [Melioribacteraceae bacterium]|nr:twin-arginine translocase subunit TatC [Melioribacteraceae bacterium]MCF8354401.1 twin-arginine translocase subunit TatC [Melioribacteraceae bacterium]MCF8393002.1 twin-arginine translocase subunit TatC [Melioribacteraceae bacterium]MCF8417255.1 twin-arginine translocase subunit TatC [Melioribacteraceae bacterium]